MPWLIIISLLIGLLGGYIAPKKPLVTMLAIFLINGFVTFMTDQANYGIWLHDYGWPGFVLPSLVAGVVGGLVNACKN